MDDCLVRRVEKMYRKEINIQRKIVHQFGFIYKIIQGCTVNKIYKKKKWIS